jgi:hypothetical protein
MRILISLSVLLLGTVSACTDDAIIATGPRQVPERADAATDPLSHANRLPPAFEQQVSLLRADLEAIGYLVARGYWTRGGPRTTSIRSR